MTTDDKIALAAARAEAAEKACTTAGLVKDESGFFRGDSAEVREWQVAQEELGRLLEAEQT